MGSAEEPQRRARGRPSRRGPGRGALQGHVRTHRHTLHTTDTCTCLHMYTAHTCMRARKYHTHTEHTEMHADTAHACMHARTYHTHQRCTQTLHTPACMHTRTTRTKQRCTQTLHTPACMHAHTTYTNHTEMHADTRTETDTHHTQLPHTRTTHGGARDSLCPAFVTVARSSDREPHEGSGARTWTIPP